MARNGEAAGDCGRAPNSGERSNSSLRGIRPRPFVTGEDGRRHPDKLCISAIGDDDLPQLIGLTAHAANGLNFGIAASLSVGRGEDGGVVKGVSTDAAGDEDPDVKCIVSTSLGVRLRNRFIVPPKPAASSISSLVSSWIEKSKCGGGSEELWSKHSANEALETPPTSDSTQDG